jgi:hypothetical protein
MYISQLAFRPSLFQKQRILVTVDGKKQPLLGTGAWNKPATNLDGFTSALSAVHTGLGWTIHTDYVPACHGCWKNYQKKVFYCKTHTQLQQFQSWSTGTVIQSAYYKSTKAFILADAGQPVKYQLLPSEVRRIGEYCISSGSSFQVSIFICLLFAVDLFLHKEEFLWVDFDSFINNLMIMSDEYLIDGLVVKLKKKRTGSVEEKAGMLVLLLFLSNIHTNDVTLTALKRGVNIGQRYATIWGDREHSDLDLVRHLLAYIYMMRWKGGYLFPTSKEAANPPVDGIYKTCISAGELCAEVGKIMVTVLGGTHKLAHNFTQPTAYLFAMFRSVGPPNMVAITQAAAHSMSYNSDDHFTMAGYSRDAETVKHALSLVPNGKDDEKLGPWMTPYCDGGAKALADAAMGAQFHRPLPEIARGFVEEVVKINPFDPQCRNPIFLFARVRQWRRPSTAKESLLVCAELCMSYVRKSHLPLFMARHALVF